MPQTNKIKPTISLEAYAVGEKIVGVAVLKERVSMHANGKIRKGKRGDLLVSDGEGLNLFLPAEAFALFTRESGHDDDVAEFVADIYIV